MAIRSRRFSDRKHGKTKRSFSEIRLSSARICEGNSRRHLNPKRKRARARTPEVNLFTKCSFTVVPDHPSLRVLQIRSTATCDRSAGIHPRENAFREGPSNWLYRTSWQRVSPGQPTGLHKMRVRKDYEKILPRNDASLTDSRKWLMMGMFPPQAKIKRNLRSGVRDSV